MSSGTMAGSNCCRFAPPSRCADSCAASILPFRAKRIACEPGRFLRLAGVFRGWTQCGLLCSGDREVAGPARADSGLYEVYKRVSLQRGTHAALQAASTLQHGRMVELTATLALAAARLSQALKLPMADSIILASARAENAVIWTQDSDFQRLPGVKFRAKKT